MLVDLAMEIVMQGFAAPWGAISAIAQMLIVIAALAPACRAVVSRLRDEGGLVDCRCLLLGAS